MPEPPDSADSADPTAPPKGEPAGDGAAEPAPENPPEPAVGALHPAPEAAISAPADAAPDTTASAGALESSGPAASGTSSFVFFGVVAGVSLLLDVATKAWAQIELSKRLVSDPSIVLVDDHLFLTLAYNKGGAWGLLQSADESVRKPFFFLVSLLAIGFIVSLYNRLGPRQHALRWGLPLVLGGALGNLSDRVVRSSVVDFIDYRADWVRQMNELITVAFSSWSVTDHWPTFNVADISICIGVGLMAVDMFTSRRGAEAQADAAPTAAEPDAPGSANGQTAPNAGASVASVPEHPGEARARPDSEAPPSERAVLP